MRIILFLAGMFSFAAHALNVQVVSGMGTWDTGGLLARDISGDGVVDAYYDVAQDLTWTKNAEYGVELGIYGSYNVSWSSRNLLHDYMNTTETIAGSGWRLPHMADPSAQCPFTDPVIYDGGVCGYNVDTGSSELAYLYHVILGNISLRDTDGVQVEGGFDRLMNSGPFENFVNSSQPWMDPYLYSSGHGWKFNFLYGNQKPDGTYKSGSVWAVHDGDIGASVVPVPAAVWLFGSALVGLGWIRRKR